MKLFNRNKFLFLFFLVLLGVNNCYSQNEGILWRITKSNLKDTSYLFGSNHTIEDTVLIPKVIKNTIINSTVFYQESKKELFSNIKMISFLFENGIKKNVKKIDKDQFNFLTRFCIDSLNIPQNRFNVLVKFRPMIIVSDIDKYANKKMNIFIKTYSIDDSVRFIAIRNHLKIKGLEKTSELLEQMRLMSFYDEYQLYLGNIGHISVKDFIKKDEKYDYLQGRSFLCGKIEEMKDFELACFSPMVMNRNFRWITEIEKSIQVEKVFISVGIGHILPEKYGLIDILRSKGYTVECILKEFK